MTLAVAIAKATGEDISKKLLAKAETEENPVRSGIMKLMADKRFLSTVSPVMMWQEDAAEALEEFAEEAENERKAGMLTDDRMKDLIEKFFAIWRMMMQNKMHLYQASRKARKKAKMDAVGRSPDNRPSDGTGGGEKSGSAGKKDIDQSLKEFMAEEKSEESAGSDDGSEGMGIGSGDPKAEQQKRENLFLKSIPESLKKLAMLIGRAGEEEMGTKGRFLTASKSDIEGITVGNNLSALLPSEVAMLLVRAFASALLSPAVPLFPGVPMSPRSALVDVSPAAVPEGVPAAGLFIAPIADAGAVSMRAQTNAAVRTAAALVGLLIARKRLFFIF